MAHIHPVYDTDCHFKIDPDSRDITYDGTDPLVLIQNDHNSEHYTFEIPRYVDGHVMMLCNLVQVHYINIDAENGGRNPGVYEVTDLQLATDDENVVICSWAISQNGTQLVGSLVFALRFACMTGDTIDYAWNTIAYSRVAISSGIYNAEAVATKYADVLETWYQNLVTAGETSIAEIKRVAEEFTPEIVQEFGGNEGKVMSQKATTKLVAEVKDLFQVGTNLYDESKETVGKILWPQGNWQDLEDYKVSNYIPVSVGDTLTAWFTNDEGKRVGTSIRTVAAYDSEFNLLPESGSKDGVSSYIVPEGVAYIRMSFVASRSQIAVVRGTTEANGYMPYKFALKPEHHDSEHIKQIVIDTIEENAEDDKTADANFEFLSSTNRLDMSKVTIGKYMGENGKIYDNAGYKYTDYIPVSVGEKITFQAKFYSNNTGVGRHTHALAFVTAFDEQKNLLPDAGRNINYGGSQSAPYVVPDGVAYIICTITSSMEYDERTWKGFGEQAIVASDVIIPYEEYEVPHYALKREAHNAEYIKELAREVLPHDDGYSWLTVFLPDEIVCAVGRTIEIYNSQVCPLAEKYHFRWVCSIGKALKRKFSITGTDALIGNHKLELYIYNDKLEQIYYKEVALKIVANTLTANVTICPIGDSLSNGQYWLKEVNTLSSGKISYVGTRSRTVDGLTVGHEGRSGWKSGDMLEGKTYDYESEGVHPFWDGEKFSWSYYKQTTGLNPNGVQIAFGTNELSWEAFDVYASNMRAMVDSIRSNDATLPIFIVLLPLTGNQNGIGVQQSNEGYTVQVGKYKYGQDVYFIGGAKALYEELKSYENLYFVPLTQCHDSEYNFGAVETPVNPRATQTELMPVEGVHPRKQGYEQMADVMFSVYCNTFGS